jgi:hypothetical protein
MVPFGQRLWNLEGSSQVFLLRQKSKHPRPKAAALFLTLSIGRPHALTSSVSVIRE